VSLAVYNVTGQKVRTPVDGYMNAGVHIIRWDGTNDRGEVVSGGIYFYRVMAEGGTVTKKMILLR
jgi:flagellar hook assembly protein FlgD